MKFHVPLVIKTRYILDTASKCPYMQRLMETSFFSVGILGAGHNVKNMDWWSPQNDDPHGRSMFFYIYRVETTKRSWILLDYCNFPKVLVDSCTDTNTFFAFLDLWLVPSHIIIVVLYSPPWWLVRDFDAKSSGIFRQRKPHWSGCSGWKNRFVSPQPSHICQKCRGGIFQGWSVCFFVSNSNKINPWVTRKVLAYCISLHQSCQILLQSFSNRHPWNLYPESHAKWSCKQFLCPSMSNSAFLVSVPKSLAHSLVTLDSPSDWHQLGCSSHMGICICNMQGGWIST